MSSTYSDRLKLELMATGANANTWGTNTNNNLDVIDAFAAGYLSKSVAGSANITLTTANASDTAEASNKTIELTGALTGDIVVFIPAVESEYNFFNNTTGSQTLTIAATGHTANGVVIAQGAKTTVFCDGASNFNVEILSSTDAGALGSGTLPDARFPATLPAVSGANLTNLDAADLASGTIPDARFPATLPALNGSALTDLNATALASGTVNNARLDTVPTTKGGTGLTSIGSAGQVLTVNAPGAALEFADAAAGGLGANCVITCFTSPGTFTPHADAQATIVSVTGAGGGGGGSRNNPGNSGQSSCFGSLLVATGGTGGSCQASDKIGTGVCVMLQGGCPDLNVANAWGMKGMGGAYTSGGKVIGDDVGLQCGQGGNGGGPAPTNQRGRGGGAGGVAVGYLTASQVSGPVAITVGNAGNGGTGDGPNGNAGNKGRVKIVEIIP